MKKLILALQISMLLGGVSGCAVWRDTPRSRLGALPFHGPFTLYTTAEADHLGRHRYGRIPRFFQDDEKERGIMYTRRAGFVDIAHLRITIDWTRYYIEHLNRAIREGQTSLVLEGNDARLHVTLRYPEDWLNRDADEREALTRELSIRGGQRLAYLLMTWHEIITWFGHRSFFLVDESPSAFTWDDTMSHVVGLRVAETAVRDTSLPFDDAVTAALTAELHRLQAVPADETNRAVQQVKGLWWELGRPLKRQFNVGSRDYVVYPWLVPGWTCDDPEPLDLPRLNDVLGQDFSSFFNVDLEPTICAADRLRDLVPHRPALFNQKRDVPFLLRAVRQQMRDRFGPDVNHPS